MLTADVWAGCAAMTYRAVSCTHQPLRLKGKGAKVLFRIQGVSKSGSAGLLRSAWVWFCCSRDEMTDRFDFILPPLPFSTDSGLFFVSIFSPRVTDGHEIKDIGWSRLFSLLIKLKKKIRRQQNYYTFDLTATSKRHASTVHKRGGMLHPSCSSHCSLEWQC